MVLADELKIPDLPIQVDKYLESEKFITKHIEFSPALNRTVETYTESEDKICIGKKSTRDIFNRTRRKY